MKWLRWLLVGLCFAVAVLAAALVVIEANASWFVVAVVALGGAWLADWGLRKP